MTVDVATYIKLLEAKKGKLEKWELEIFQLFHADVSYQAIADYLRLNDVGVSKMEIYRFIHRKKRHRLMTNHKVETHSAQGRQTVTQLPGNGIETALALPQKGKQDGAALPRFNWRQHQETDKPKW